MWLDARPGRPARCLDDGTIDDLAAGRLADAELEAADAHLDACASCSAVVAALLESEGEGKKTALELPPGSRVGRYVVEEVLGEGAMGIVVAGFDPDLKRRVALKLLHPLGPADTLAERLAREGRAMARLHHPNVVAVYDVGTFDERVYLAMELVVGETLRDWLRRPRTQREIVAVMLQAGEGLRAAHAVDLVHRDFKPENILVGADGRVRVTDLGLARGDPNAEMPIEDADVFGTRASTFAGTPAYMAPEQLQRRGASVESDQYAFATTLWEALLGERPFEADSVAALLRRMERGVAESKAGLPRALHRPLARALSYDAAKRFPSMSALLDELAKAQRRPLWSIVSAGGALLAASGIALGWSLDRPAVDRCVAPSFELVTAARESAIGEAFRRASTAGGDRASAWAIAALRSYRNAWVDASSSSCRALTSSPTTAVSRCLASHQRKAEALASSLEGASAATVASVDEIVGALDPPSECLSLGGEAEPASDADASFEATVATVSAKLAGGEVSQATSALLDPGLGDPSLSRTLRARALSLRARLARQRGDFGAAAKDAEEALLVSQASRDDLGVARAWLERMAVEGERGAWSTAEGYARLADASLERVGRPPAMVASLRLAQGVVATNLGQFDAARAALDEALRVRIGLWGPAHPRVAEVMTALGVLAFQRGDLAGARTLHERAREIDASIFGDDHPIVARHEHNLGGVLRAEHELSGARRRYERALELEVAGFGATHPSAARTLNSLGLVALERGDLSEADERFAKAEAIFRPLGHAEASTTDHNRALVALRRGDAAGAKDRANTALSYVASRGLEGSLIHARILRTLAEALLRLGETQPARESAERARGIAQKIGGPAAEPLIASLEDLLRPSAVPVPTVKAVSPKGTRPTAPTAPTAAPTGGSYAPSQTFGR